MKHIMIRCLYALAAAVLCAPAFAAVPVTAAKDQAALLKSNNPKLAANKKLVYDCYRIVIQGRHLDQAGKYLKEDFIQHNPNADTGLAGLRAYFSKQGGPRAIPATLNGLVAIQAEGDYVTLSFVRQYDDPKDPGHKYTTTWFDMYRIENGKIAEHWDTATKPNPAAQK
jgi:predicted SnoaL-like aldol condensation-catalyzing enzyme